MLDFRTVSIADKAVFDKYTDTLDYHLCGYCFADIIMWTSLYNTQFCEYDDYLFIRYNESPNKIVYQFPLTTKSDIATGVKLISQDAKNNGYPFILSCVTEENKASMQAQMPDEFEYMDDRGNADYIYLSERLETLVGKKLHSKRNYINRFKNAYPDRWYYKPITDENLREVFNFHIQWCEINDCSDNTDFFHETCAASRGLKNLTELGLIGGALYLDDKIIAYTFGSKSGRNMFITHIEKADHTISGAYQMINQQFAIALGQNTLYINREQDLGIEGLRKAKLSYYPDIILDSYIAIPKEK